MRLLPLTITHSWLWGCQIADNFPLGQKLLTAKLKPYPSCHLPLNIPQAAWRGGCEIVLILRKSQDPNMVWLWICKSDIRWLMIIIVDVIHLVRWQVHILRTRNYFWWHQNKWKIISPFIFNCQGKLLVKVSTLYHVWKLWIGGWSVWPIVYVF